MTGFRAILFTSVLAGLIGGAAITAVQHVGTSQLILQAEVFEKAGETAAPLPHHHEAAAPEHDHNEAAWEPADGLERTGFTLAANILTGIGYALVLTGLMSLRGRPVNARDGLLWGLAGFACVMLAPMLGLPPELPGMPVAPLGERQLWWIGTALATAAGLGLVAFRRSPWAAVGALAMIVLPHLIGAPVAPEAEHATVPAALERPFIVAAVLTSLVFWSLLGGLTGGILRRFGT